MSFVHIIRIYAGNGNKYVVLCVCSLTKYVEGAAIKTKDALSVARVLFENIYCRYGAHEVQISDQGREVSNNSVQSALKEHFGVEMRTTAPYHPQANGIAGTLYLFFVVEFWRFQQVNLAC